MKKLMTILVAATATMFAFGDVTLPTGTSFETRTATGAVTDGPVLVRDIANTDDSGNQDGLNKFWYSTADENGELGALTNDVAGSGLERPDMFKNEAQSKSLFIETSTTEPLVRTALPNGGASSVNPVDMTTGDGIYLDTLVKFTAADSAFTEMAAGDKIAIEYVEHEADETTGEEGYTNFVIRAGLINGSALGQTNYVAAVPAGFNKDEWHRLTVRTIADVGDGHVGFVIYLDGDPNKTLEYSTDVDAGFNTASLTAVAAKFYSSEKHALFPSAIAAGATGGSTISSVAFSGNGFIDDVSFSSETPNFIKSGEAVSVAITLGTGVTGVTVTIGETTYDPVDATATPLVFNLPAGTTNFVLGVAADTANGYTFDEATGITLTDATYDAASDTVAISGAAPALTVVGKRDNVYYMNGDQKVGFETLSDAFATAPAGTTLKLGYDYSVDKDVMSDYAPVFVIAKNLILDLNGKELDGGSGNARALFSVNVNCVLTVIDSVPGDDGSIIYGGTFGMFAGAGDTIIGSATDYGPVIIGAAIGNNGYVSEIVRGKFSAAENTTANDEFVCGTDDDTAGINVIADDSTFSRVGDYWVVAPQGGSTTFALTTTGGAHATVTTSPADVSALTEATQVTITATAEQDYTYDGVDLTGTDWTYDSQTDAISMTTNISENTEIAVPDAVSEQQSGYDSGDGEHTFVIDSATEDELEDNLPAGKTLASAVSEGSSLTYAQAYALGLWDAQATTVTDLDATISVGADGKVTVTLANAPTTGYLVQCKVYEKASLTAEWPTEAKATYAYGNEQPFTPGSATAGFYKVAVVITNSLQQ